MLKREEIEPHWTDACAKLLVGKTVKRVYYMGKKDADELGWSGRSLIIQFTDGTEIQAMSDDEGNDGGAYATNDDKLPTIPVI